MRKREETGSAAHAARLGEATAARFLRERVAPGIDPRDLIQEAILGAISAHVTYRVDRGAGWRTWVIEGARNACLSFLRREWEMRERWKVLAEAEDVWRAPHVELPDLDLSYVYALVTAPQAEAIRLLVEEGVSFVEAGRRLGIHRKAVWDRLEGAERRLRRAR